MSVFLNNKVGVKIASTDVSDHVSAVTLTRNFDELEVSAMGDLSHRFVKGLEASTVTIDFFNDEATASVLPTLLLCCNKIGAQQQIWFFCKIRPLLFQPQTLYTR